MRGNKTQGPANIQVKAVIVRNSADNDATALAFYNYLNRKYLNVATVTITY